MELIDYINHGAVDAKTVGNFDGGLTIIKFDHNPLLQFFHV
jgi:hypothetical protein